MEFEFNSELMYLLDDLFKITKEKKFKKFYIIVKNSIDDEERKRKYIDQYVMNFLVYKNEIYNRNAKFFLDKEINTDNSSIISEMISLKGIFKSLKQDEQEIIIDHLIVLTKISETYLKSYTD